MGMGMGMDVGVGVGAGVCVCEYVVYYMTACVYGFPAKEHYGNSPSDPQNKTEGSVSTIRCSQW